MTVAGEYPSALEVACGEGVASSDEYGEWHTICADECVESVLCDAAVCENPCAT